ncbi:hypothetical protein P280DRAFT_388755 [Massarina eburnea CBS 473.64]|uniref:Uncharacterized protein n=1 Tax=Massarina eburnea CBS 473.64 TaxID=1395130 RepID=A0A6A6SEC0_9PLEO|nr:hypothetical protein P280DRAFT_388755 [Massarina eburnea CBS 473.64]
MDTADEDPVVAEYDVFITPEMEEQLYVLQYLNRPPDDPFTQATGSKPDSLRLKQHSGFLEVDVPLNVHQHFNRQMGVQWGEALRKTKQFGQKAYGIASGFERTMPRLNRPGAAAADGQAAPATATNDDNYEEYVENFEDANEKGHVLNMQTFGGQIQHNDAKGPTYMLGTFRKNELHLTKLKGLVQMRTQFHHIDAIAQLEAANRRREKEAQEGAKQAEPKAFVATVKKAGGDTAAEITQAFMKATNAEKWQRLDYMDENSPQAFESFEERLFLPDTAAAAMLHSNMTNNQYLDAISAPSAGRGLKKRPSNRRQGAMVEISDDSDAGEEPTVSGKKDGDGQALNSEEMK